MSIFNRFRGRPALGLTGRDVDIIRLGLRMVKLIGAEALEELPDGLAKATALGVLQDAMRIDAALARETR